MTTVSTDINARLSQYLTDLSQSRDSSLKAEIAQIILDESDGEIARYIQAVLTYGVSVR